VVGLFNCLTVNSVAFTDYICPVFVFRLGLLVWLMCFNVYRLVAVGWFLNLVVFCGFCGIVSSFAFGFDIIVLCFVV